MMRSSRRFGLLACCVFALALPCAGQTRFPSSGYGNSISIDTSGYTAGQLPAYGTNSTIAVSGLTGTISSITVELYQVSHPYDLVASGIMLTAPTGEKLVLVQEARYGDGGGFNNLTINLSDSAGGLMPNSGGAPSNTSVDFRPTAYTVVGSWNSGGISCTNCPVPDTAGSATLASQFGGISPNGTWTLSARTNYSDEQLSIGGWSMTITVAASADPSSTALTSSQNPNYTSSPNDAVTFTATVTSGGNPVNSEGTITFKNGSTVIAGPTAINGSGQATYATTGGALGEGTHSITAEYSGTVNYGSSVSTAVSQVVMRHPDVTGNRYCNPTSISIPTGTADGQPANIYPSYLDVALTGTIAKVTVALNSLSHNSINDVDMLLVSPAGQKLVLFSDIANMGQAVAGIGVALDDAASSLLPDASAPISDTYRPTAYDEGSADVFPAPAPGSLSWAPTQGATTLATFNGSSPTGAWALYIVDQRITVGGSLAGGWCLDFTLVSPDLTIDKSHSGNFRQGGTGSYSLVVTNSGSGGTSGLVTVTDTPSSGLTVTSMSGTGWTCTVGTRTCTRSDSLAAAGSYPAITVGVDVADDAAATESNAAAVSGGGDSTAGNNTDTDSTTVDQVADLTVAKSHTGNFTEGQTGATYTVTVTNSGAGPTVGTVTLTETEQTGFTVSGLSGTGWTCVLGTLTCTRSDALAAGNSYLPVTVTVNVASDAPASVTNSVTVSGGGELNVSNNVGNDATTINQLADLTLAKTHSETFRQGDTGRHYTLTVTNDGDGATSGLVTVVDDLVSGLTVTDISGTGWACTTATRTCTRSDALTAGSSYPAITVTVTVANNAASSITNTASVSGGGEIITNNNTASDPTAITQAADMTVAKSHSGDFRQGQTGAQYTITATNSGPGATDGSTVTVTDTLPPGLTATGLSGTGWSCMLGTLTCTRSDALASAGSYPAITLTVSVANNAAAGITNSAAVSGGGEVITNNNSDDDATTVEQAADLTVAKQHSGNFTQGQTGAQYSITVTNSGPGPTVGTVTVADTLPTGLTATAISGTGWSCVLGTLTCTRSDALAAAGSYAAITLTVTVAGNAAANISNSAAVSGGGELNTANNTATDATTVIQLADPSVTLTHTGHFTRGQQGTYTITVQNVGSASTTGGVSITDTLPASMTPASISGTGWVCTLSPLACAHPDARATGESYPAITLTVNVATDAGTPLTNSVTVTAATDLDAANSTATDSTVILVIPSVSWATPANITYGTALSATQLNASSPVAGSFAYSPVSDTVLAAGTHTLGATFTPADPNTYASTTASVSLTVDKATPVITWTDPAAITYRTALSATQLNASTGVAGSFEYSPASGAILNAGSHTLSTTFTPTDTANYNNAAGSVTQVVDKLTPVVTWATPASIVYGTALSGTQLNASTTEAGTFVYSPAAGTVLAVGSHTLGVTFTPTDTANVNGATGSVTQSVTRATPVITWATPAAITYGTALSATQLNATANVAGSFAYSPDAPTVLAAGNQTLNVTFTPTDTANYNGASASVTLAVNQQAPVITWATPAAITYGTALSATQLNATANVAGTFAYSPDAPSVLAAGSQALGVIFTPTDTANYSNATASVTLTVNKQAPVITWATPAAITYGTALSATQLNATANVAGSFAYSPDTGAVLNAGSNTLNVTFTPTDTANYETANASVSLTVNQAAPVITWATPAAITYGAAIGATQLNATANVAGSFVYSPAAGAVLPAGNNTLGVTFTPTSANYATGTASVVLAVNQSTPVITWTTPAPITYGTALSATQLAAAANVPGSFVYTPPAGTILAAGNHTLSAAFTPSDAANHTTASATAPLTVNRATPVLTWPAPAAIVAGSPLTATQLNATAAIPGAFVYSPPAGTVLDSGTHTLTVVFTPTDTANYNSATASVSLAAGLDEQTVVFATIPDRWHGDPIVPLSATATSGLPVSFEVLSGPAAISGNTLTLTGVGLVTVRAVQGGNPRWAAASATRSFRSAWRTRIESGIGIVTVDGVAFQSGGDFLWEPGTIHQVSAPLFQGALPGRGYRFAAWSDGATASRAITAATQDTSYTAVFVQQYRLTLEILPSAAAGRVTTRPVSPNGFYDADSQVVLEAIPGAGHYFAAYTGGATGASRTASLQMTAPQSVTARFEAGVKLEAVVDSAGYRPGALAPAGLYSLFGWGMGETAMATLPLPANLSGRSIAIGDRDGHETPALLLYVSERQINFLLPEGLAPGPATLRLTVASGQSAELAIEIAPVAPALFTANQSGRGAPAGTWLRVAADGSRIEQPLAVRTETGFVPAEIGLGAPDDTVFLVLYGTGLRHGTAVSAMIGGVPAPVLYSGAQGFFEGLDQLNLRLPRDLAGRGEVEIVVTIDGLTANEVKIRVK